MVTSISRFGGYLCSVRLLKLLVISGRTMHFKCRNCVYPRSEVKRLFVPDANVSWDVTWTDYSPPSYTSPNILKQPWADKDLTEFSPQFNSLDGTVNRVSHTGIYKISKDGYPLNPVGRTGISGRGVLGRWGPNHAADPIVTRWKRGKSGALVKDNTTELPILQFVAIERRDCKQWAIPGGMVDPGEIVTSTLRREFLEEALNSLEKDKEALEKQFMEFFDKGKEVFKGYVDDPRNTDNAWMETVAYNFHDEDGVTVGHLPLQAGDDAQRVCWMDLNCGLNLYASHFDILKKVVEVHCGSFK